MRGVSGRADRGGAARPEALGHLLGGTHRPGYDARCNADVAQLVEHHLAKVRVAGSNPVVRST